MDDPIIVANHIPIPRYPVKTGQIFHTTFLVMTVVISFGKSLRLPIYEPKIVMISSKYSWYFVLISTTDMVMILCMPMRPFREVCGKNKAKKYLFKQPNSEDISITSCMSRFLPWQDISKNTVYKSILSSFSPIIPILPLSPHSLPIHGSMIFFGCRHIILGSTIPMGLYS